MSIAEDQFSAVKDIANDHAEAIADADSLLVEIAEENRRPALAELIYFDRHCGWDETKVRQEVRRMGAVMRLRSIAGTPSDREAAALEATTAAKILKTEGAKVQAKIEELQAKLNGLDRDARLSAKRVEEQAVAVQQLRGLVPQHVRDAVNERVSAIEHSIGRQIADAEIRANELRCCLTPSLYSDQAAYLDALRRSFRDAVASTNHAGFTKYSLSPAWPSIRDGIEAELTELEERLPKMRAEHDEAIATAEKPLSHYAG
jgi:hypothetical protein